MRLMHEIMDPQIPAGSIVVLGDSITQSFYPRSSRPSGAVNSGIGSNTSLIYWTHCRSIAHCRRAEIIIVQIGRNDLYKRGAEETIRNIRNVYGALPQGPRVLVSGILPMNESRINKNMAYKSEADAVNVAIKAMCSGGRCTMIDVGPMADANGVLREEFDFGDGLNLSKLGYEKWDNLLLEALPQ